MFVFFVTFFCCFGHFFFIFFLVRILRGFWPIQNKIKKVSEKNKKKWQKKQKFLGKIKKYFFKKSKFSFRGGNIFFFKKKWKKKKLSKLSVSKNGHFQCCPHIRLTMVTFPPPTVMYVAFESWYNWSSWSPTEARRGLLSIEFVRYCELSWG